MGKKPKYIKITGLSHKKPSEIEIATKKLNISERKNKELDYHEIEHFRATWVVTQ